MKVDFKKSYDKKQDETRFELFRATLKQIDDHNVKFKKGEVEHEAGLNEYSDWNDAEKMKLIA
ncbi:CLUMA_CG013536, isoform A [Clunio marinus]|uniref:CLUMA_CG013536, isoform A n=1 Tax=Clunio marinus TaxID=568069 RepID=A0A1J1IJ40_9DIPT|nr:CLUMA_CG013536, isoform A [Clunio marinus]